MRHLKFTEAVKLARILRRPQRFPLSDACQRSFDIFRSNIEIAKALLVVPGASFHLGCTWQNSTEAALREIAPGKKGEEITQSSFDKIGQRAEELFVRAMRHPENKHEEAIIVHSTNLERMVSSTVIHQALELTLKSVIIQVWTSFEVLTEQLFNMTLEKHSELFSAEVMAKKEKFRFRKLGAIQSAYKEAFSDSEIDEILDDTTVKACAQLRHLLIHCDGIVDQKFLDECAKEPTVRSFLQWKKGQRIQVDGNLLYSLTEPVLHSGFSLIESVYGWICE